jgi:myo-inositol-1(or 4)-monophosphatase
MTLNLGRALEFSIDTVREAGELLRTYWRQGVTADYKGAIDLVTEADRVSERLILDRIRSAYPDQAILSEESGSNQADSPYVWIVDPLDGTTNFAHGYPIFSVTMALQVNGTLTLGTTFDPLRNELFTAQRGQGAYLNERPIHVSTTRSLDRGLLVTGFPYDRRTNPHNNLKQYAAFTLKAQSVLRSGSAALDLASVACGRLDGYWEFRLSPWDLAAGILLVNEAGGRLTLPDGQPVIEVTGDIVASNDFIHAEMLEVLRAA